MSGPWLLVRRGGAVRASLSIDVSAKVGAAENIFPTLIPPFILWGRVVLGCVLCVYVMYGHGGLMVARWLYPNKLLPAKPQWSFNGVE